MTVAIAQKGAKQNTSRNRVRFRTLLASQEKELYARVQRGLGGVIAGRERDERTLREMKDALVRLKAGSYGVCEVCNIIISSARLEALPWTRKCVKCAENSMAAQSTPLEPSAARF